ncbi:MAG: hypothetical protein AAB508_00515 [Patescibacteria group bacterium]
MIAIIIIGIVIYLLLLLEWIYRSGFIHAEYSRKIAHVLACCIAAAASQILSRDVFIYINILFVVIFLYIRWKKILVSIEGVDRFTYGSVCLPLGFIVIGIFLYSRVYEMLIGLAIVGIADTCAGFVRYRFKLPKSSWIAFVIVWVCSFATSRFIFGNIQSLLIASLVSMAEVLSGYGTDNLTIPLVYALLVYFFK